jgi:hypothetical protein
MAKIKLGARPKNFKHTVKFPMLEGEQGSIECVFKYRTRKEFGTFIDGIMEGAKVQPQTNEDGQPAFSMAALMEKTAGSNADYIMQVCEGWSLDEEFSRSNVQQLADELPAAAAAIMEAYRAAITEGRLGN